MPCAKRFGGPATSFGGPSRGAMTRVASRPSRLNRGPEAVRVANPMASSRYSQGDWVSSVAAASTATPPATTRAAFSFTGCGKENSLATMASA